MQMCQQHFVVKQVLSKHELIKKCNESHYSSEEENINFHICFCVYF